MLAAPSGRLAPGAGYNQTVTIRDGRALEADRSGERPLNPWLVLATVSIGTFMATLDSSSVNVALPAIAHDYGASIAQVSWISIIYFLVITCLLLVMGRLADLTKRGPVYAAGMAILGLASGLCGLAPNLGWLVAMRALQALGGAMVMANSPALTASAFPGHQRGAALGIVTLVATVGSSAGPTVGGFIIATWGWHGIFLINLPIGLIGSVQAFRLLGRVPQAPSQERGFDGLGAVLSVAGLGALLLALREGEHMPSALAWSLGVGGFLALLAFLRWEARHRHPLLQPRLFLRRAFASATGSSFLSFAARSSCFLLLPFFLERVQGYSPVAVGFMMTSFPLAVALVAPLSGRASDRLGTRGLTIAGQLVSALALVGLATLPEQAPMWRVIGPQALLGIGAALFQSPNNSAMLGAVEGHELGMASALLAVTRNLGLVVGSGLAAAIVAAQAGGFMAGFRQALLVSTGLAILSAVAAGVRNAGVIAGRSLKEEAA